MDEKRWRLYLFIDMGANELLGKSYLYSPVLSFLLKLKANVRVNKTRDYYFWVLFQYVLLEPDSPPISYSTPTPLYVHNLCSSIFVIHLLPKNWSWAYRVFPSTSSWTISMLKSRLSMSFLSPPSTSFWACLVPSLYLCRIACQSFHNGTQGLLCTKLTRYSWILSLIDISNCACMIPLVIWSLRKDNFCWVGNL